MKNLKKVLELPSYNEREYWIHYHTDNKYPKHKNSSGKWLIPCEEKKVNKTWSKIKKLQDKDLLGSISKVSTLLLSKKHKGTYIICVYTYDYNDKEDVMKIRKNLEKNGFTEKLNYKTDEKTRKLVYNTVDEFDLTI